MNLSKNVLKNSRLGFKGDAQQKLLHAATLSNSRIQERIAGRTGRNLIVVSKKLVNIVV
jgi:aldehyde:ferredoxin oxidoreductase